MTTKATLTIPDHLYERLKARAAEEQQSVEEYSIEVLEHVIQSTDQTEQPLTRDEEMRRIREAMKGQLWSEEDVAQLFPWLDDEQMTDEEARRIIAAIPPLDPPLSQTVIEMRNEERY